MNRRSQYLLLILTAFMLSGCAAFRDISMFSTEQEVELGRSVASQVEEEMKLLDDPVVVNYVREVGNRVAAQAVRQDIEYLFDVVDSDQINAFAVPGGWIYIFTGLLKEMQTEAELAAVLSHEVAHIAERHSMEQLTRQIGFSVVLNALFGQEAAAWQAILAQASTGLLQLRFSRNDEREADTLGLDYMYAAGYTPQGMVDLLSIFLALSDREPTRVEQWLSTHPYTGERIELVQGYITEQNLELTGRLGREDYQRIMRRLR